jgi:hypothetical protein
MIINQYLSFKTKPYKPIESILRHGNKISSFHMLPIVTNVSMTIEERAAI